jgi:hypothetical protein
LSPRECLRPFRFPHAPGPTHSQASSLAENTVAMHSGMGQKVGFLVHNLGTLVAGFAVGFLRSWKLTLVIMSFLPLLVIAGTIIKVAVRASFCAPANGCRCKLRTCPNPPSLACSHAYPTSPVPGSPVVPQSESSESVMKAAYARATAVKTRMQTGVAVCDSQGAPVPYPSLSPFSIPHRWRRKP